MMIKQWIAGILILTTLCGYAKTLTASITTPGPREGVIAVLVFKDKKGFPSKHKKAFRKARFPVTAEDPVVCAITNLPYGEYSLSVLHDINDNYKADKLLGIGPPKEPIGFSGIDRKLRKQPSFEETVFTFNAQTNTISVALRYVI